VVDVSLLGASAAACFAQTLFSASRSEHSFYVEDPQ
jgi:hypothetical protein